ncbi:hypothetical protein [Cellulomonas terrae]|uniref:Uncharacterized protein n=1 Tax=Cellulomonas terrae TaxID=311234 RepID=A0A511JJI7_9CELL|nr:hypothetical protein [Cellulomonas terrae]GEL97803.1 hypothetical protein CTE05_13500 [Cellulomonas terrae]
MPPLWTARRLFWTGVAVALGARLVAGFVLGPLVTVVAAGYTVLALVEQLAALAVYAGAAMVGASFVVRVLGQRGVVPASARNANSARPHARSNKL